MFKYKLGEEVMYLNKVWRITKRMRTECFYGEGYNEYRIDIPGEYKYANERELKPTPKVEINFKFKDGGNETIKCNKVVYMTDFYQQQGKVLTYEGKDVKEVIYIL